MKKNLKKIAALGLTAALTLGSIGSNNVNSLAGLFGQVSYAEEPVYMEEAPGIDRGVAFSIIEGCLTHVGDGFQGLEGNRNVVIPEGVTYIGRSAFAWLRNVESVVIPEGVTQIGGSAFYDCNKLTSVTLPSTLKSIDGFGKCTSLTEIDFPDGLAVIGGGCFGDCIGLKSITIPDSVKVIGSSAFSGCSNLEQVILPKNLKSIGARAFSACSKLDISAVLSQCTKLTSLNMSGMDCSNLSFLENLTELKELHLEGNITDLSPLAHCTKLELLSIGDNEITDWSALSSLKNLKELDLSHSKITDLSVLNSLENLEALKLDYNSLQDISALAGCKNLEDLKLGNNEIQDITPLKQCSNLKKVDLNYNNISDITPLMSCENLELVRIYSNQITDVNQLKQFREKSSADIYIAGNLIEEEELINAVFQYEQQSEVAVGLEGLVSYINSISADNAEELLTKDSIKAVSQNEEIVKVSVTDEGKINLEAVKTGTATVTVSYGDITRTINVTVIAEIPGVTSTAEILPKLENSCGDSVAVSWKSDSLWSIDVDGQNIEKKADISKTSKYIARTVYDDDFRCEDTECLTLDENDQLWNWEDNTKEKLDENVIDFDADQNEWKIIADDSRLDAYVACDNDGNIWSRRDKMLLKTDSVAVKGLGYAPYISSGLEYYHTADNVVYNPYEGYVCNHVKEIRNEQKFIYLSEDGNCYYKVSLGNYSLYCSDTIDIMTKTVYDAETQTNQITELVKTEAEGWCVYDLETGTKTPTGDKEIDGSYRLTFEGDLYYDDTKLLSDVAEFVSGYESGYAVRTDGSVWRLGSMYEIAMPTQIVTLEELQSAIVADAVNSADNDTGNDTDADDGTDTDNDTDADDSTGTDNNTDADDGTGTDNNTDADNGTNTGNNTDADNSTDTDTDTTNVMRGDADGDKAITLQDAQLVLKAALKIVKADAYNTKAADVDGKAGVELSDAQMILKAALKIIKL